MLDDGNVLAQRDSGHLLQAAASQVSQTTAPVTVENSAHDGREITNVVIAGVGQSALAAELLRSWLHEELRLPLEVVAGPTLPSYVGFNSLVIASSCSGDTSETVACFDEARERGAQLAVVSGSGALLTAARERDVAYTVLPSGDATLLTIAQLRALTAVLAHFGVIPFDCFSEIAELSGWLDEEVQAWTSDTTTDKNYAKQLALLAVGSTAVFYGSAVTAPLAHKWKTSWNETAKNVAFWARYPEASYDELTGWSSHPIEKPFVVFDIVSSFDDELTRRRFELTDKILSGRRPKAQRLEPRGTSRLEQLLWASILADFTSIYLAILNNADPASRSLLAKLEAGLVEVTE